MRLLEPIRDAVEGHGGHGGEEGGLGRRGRPRPLALHVEGGRLVGRGREAAAAAARHAHLLAQAEGKRRQDGRPVRVQPGLSSERT